MTDKLTKDNLDKEYPAILTALGGNVTEAPESVDIIKAVGDGEHRHFHHFQHFMDIANALNDTEGQGPIHSPQIKAAAKHAGLFHDIVYHHVDGFHDSIKPAIKKYIGTITDGNPLETYSFLDEGNPITAMAKTIFGMEDNQILDKFNGGNELLSAIYAAERGQAEGIPAKYQLAEMAIIEATICFLGADRMDHLATRLKTANKILPAGERLTDTEIEDTMHAATHISNIDVMGFRGKFEDFIKTTKQVIVESANDSKTLEQATTNQYNFLSGFLLPAIKDGTKKVFHGYEGVPANETLKTWNDIAEKIVEQEIEELAPRTKVDGSATSPENNPHGTGQSFP